MSPCASPAGGRHIGGMADLIETFATSCPQAVAVRAKGAEVTYFELWQTAMAARLNLINAGVKPGDAVGIAVERGVEMIVVLVALVALGAPYVPVPAEEDEYRRAVLDRAGVRFLITGADGSVELLDRRASRVHAVLAPPTVEPRTHTAEHPMRDSVAYVLHTSGSTGRPKGVRVTHGNVLNLVTGQSFARFGPGESFLQLAPLVFDPSALEIWGALLSGATLVLPEASYTQLGSLSTSLREHRVSNVVLTAALFHQLSVEDLDEPTVHRRVIVGGDVLIPARVQEFIRGSRATELVNAYGPTEATTMVSACILTPEHDLTNGVPLGSPIQGTRLSLIDDDGQLITEIGVTGEIVISGQSVAAGYLHAEDDPGHAFAENATSPAEQSYRTGDIGVLGPDRLIRFMGRRDDQVKVRGYRVEPSQIESVLAGTPGVREAAVTIEGASSDERRIIAHVVSTLPDAEPVVRIRLQTHLPPYMVPSRVEVHEKLPLTPTGKVDKRALALLTANVDRKVGQEPDEITDSERELLGIWRRNLGLRSVGVHDDFFGIGGDSLLALRVVSEARKNGVYFDVAALFEYPTVRSLIAASGEAPDRSDANEVAEIREDVPDEKLIRATSMQEGIIFESMIDDDDEVFVGVSERLVQGRFDADLFRQAVAASIEAHPALRVSFDQDDDGRTLQRVDNARAKPSIEITFGPLAAEAVRATRRMVLARQTTFDLRFGPLFKVLVHVYDGGFKLTYVFHHAIIDGWSETVLTHDLLTTYEALLEGNRPRLRQTSLRAYGENARVEDIAKTSRSTEQFWRASVAGIKPCLLRGESRDHSRSSANSVLQVPEALARRLSDAVEGRGMPLKSFLLASHMIVVSKLFELDKPVTGLVVNARPEIEESERLVGMFLNFVPLSLDVKATDPYRLVSVVSAAERAIVPHRMYPYAEIQKLAGRRLFDTAFNYVHFHLNAQLRRFGRLSASEPEMFTPAGEAVFADFVHDPVSNDLRLELEIDPGFIDGRQLKRVRDLYIEALSAVVPPR